MAERGRDRTGGRAVAAGADRAAASGFARPLAWPGDAAASFLERLRGWIVAEGGAGRLLPFVPIAFGAGIALYFSADHEPILWVTVATAIAFAADAFALRRSPAFPWMVLIAAIVAGFATATVRTAIVAHGVLARPLYAELSGFVETHEERERSDRFVLRLDRIVARHVPRGLDRVRLAARKGTAPAVGSYVRLKARMMPPLTPLRPGSYDFSRDMYFQGIGASGFVMGAITALAPPQDGGWHLRYAALMQGIRDAVDARIRTVVGGDSRAIATALLTGRRDALTTSVNDAMFISGLGHVLSISGYHMAVVAGVVFFAVRALLALIPALTVTFPIKKCAAAVALLAAAFYLLLSGSEVATQRSFLMTAVVLIAVMVDRRAITFRTLALAALIVLALAPEALVHPSFQMSFAATLGLVALVQIGLPRLLASPDHSPTARAALWGGRELMTLALASFVAGLATTPYAAFHFHRVTPYGVAANLLAMPVVSAIVMPAGLLGLAAMPFGLDGVFWRIMDYGIQWMIAVSEWVASWPGAVGRIAAFGTGPLLVASFGIVVLGLLRTPLRWSGLVLVAGSIGWMLAAAQPDVVIADDGHSVAVRGGDGRLHLMHSGRDAFTWREWLAADGDVRRVDDGSLGEGVSCDGLGCVAALPDGALVALALRPDALEDDCAMAALVISAHPPPPDCAATVIDADRLRREGSIALWRRSGRFVREAARPPGYDRPWAPAPALANGDRETSSIRGRKHSAPVDATPAEPDRTDADP